MANIEKGSTNKSLSPSTDSVIGRVDGVEEHPSGIKVYRRKHKTSSHLALGTNIEGPSKKSRVGSYISHNGKFSEEEDIAYKEKSMKESFPSHHGQNEMEFSLKEKVTGEEEEVTSKEQSERDCLHNDVARNKIDLSLKGKAPADEEVDVVNEAKEKVDTSIGKGDGNAAWVNTFDLNEFPEAQEDHA